MVTRSGNVTHQHSLRLYYAVAASALVVSLMLTLPGNLIFLMMLNAMAIAVTYIRLGRSILTPSLVFSVVLTVFGIVGFAVTDSLVRRGQILSYLGHFGGPERIGTLSIFLIASISSLAGAWLTRGRGNIRKLELADLATLGTALRNSTVALWIGSVTLIFNVALRPLDLLLERSSYLIPTDFGGVLTYLQIPAAVALGLALRSSTWPARSASLVLILLLEAFSFALSSRMMSVIALMYFVGIALSLRRSRGALLVVGAVIALILIPVPLHMRGLPKQGLIPNIQALTDVNFFSYDVYVATFANFLSAFNVVALTTYRSASIPWSSFWTSVGPLPGALLGPPSGISLRLSSAVPYAGIGEVANHGLWLVPIFFSIVGCVLGLIEGATSRLLFAGRYVYLATAPTGVAFLAAILFSQYNLRTAARMVYLNLALSFVISMLAARKSPQTYKGSLPVDTV